MFQEKKQQQKNKQKKNKLGSVSLWLPVARCPFRGPLLT